MDTKNAIKTQFMKEYAGKDFSSITVKGLCAATPAARTTFYSYFNNTDDVRREIEDDLISGLVAVSERVSGGNFPDMDFTAFMDETERFIRDHWSDIYAFLVRQPNLRFIRKWKDAIIRNFSRRNPEKRQAKSFAAIAEILSASVISAYTYWMEHPDSAGTEEIKRREHEKASIRAKVEHIFAVVKGRFRYRKTRYRGLRKQTAKLNMLFALANLVLADRPCLAV